MAGALVPMALLPDVTTGTHSRQLGFSCFFSMSQLLSRKVSNSQKKEECHQMHTRPFCTEPNLTLYPVQQLQKQRALACGQSRGCTLLLKVSQKKREGDHHSFPQSLCALLMATGGFGVKDGVTWYMLGNTLLAEGGDYSLGEKKIMEENSNYENRKYTHKRKHYCTVR